MCKQPPIPRLFYLFSSDSSTRYKRNVLDILCYPEGHIFRLRYQDKYVSEEIRGWGTDEKTLQENLNKLGTKGRKGVAVYAETSSSTPRSFNFYPTRLIEIVHIKVEGTIYYVDVRLGKFINYYFGRILNQRSDENLRTKRAAHIKKLLEKQVQKLRFYPLPPLVEGVGKTWDLSDKTKVEPVDYDSSLVQTIQGHFFTRTENQSKRTLKLYKYSEQSLQNLAWESTIDVIDRASSMERAIFYRIKGFYQIKRLWYWLWLRKREVRVKIKNGLTSTVYYLPIGSAVTLKLSFYKSGISWNKIKGIKLQELELKTKSDVFAGFSQDTIPILSRYNEELIEIACKRVFDSVFAPISIEHKVTNEKTKVENDTEILPHLLYSYSIQSNKKPNSAILAPNPYLVTKISVPGWLPWFLIALTVGATVSLTFGPDSFKTLGETNFIKNYPDFGNYLVTNNGFLAGLSKAAGGILTLVAAFLAFRKLPVGGK